MWSESTQLMGPVNYVFSADNTVNTVILWSYGKLLMVSQSFFFYCVYSWIEQIQCPSGMCVETLFIFFAFGSVDDQNWSYYFHLIVLFYQATFQVLWVRQMPNLCSARTLATLMWSLSVLKVNTLQSVCPLGDHITSQVIMWQKLCSYIKTLYM